MEALFFSTEDTGLILNSKNFELASASAIFILVDVGQVLQRRMEALDQDTISPCRLHGEVVAAMPRVVGGQ